MNSELNSFLAQFNFKKELRGYIGIERERFLVDSYDRVAPRAEEFLKSIEDPLWTYELSACQIEDRTRPRLRMPAIWWELFRNDIRGARIAKKIGLRIASLEVGPEGMPLAAYPEARYQEIITRISPEQRKAACRVAGVHVHVGMGNMQEAISAYCLLRAELEPLCALGDNSHGERLRLYKTMAKIWDPPPIESESHFFEIAREQGFLAQPRNCYWLIRISPHGTIELRMFGATESRMRILHYITRIRAIINCAELFNENPHIGMYETFRWG